MTRPFVIFVIIGTTLVSRLGGPAQGQGKRPTHQSVARRSAPNQPATELPPPSAAIELTLEQAKEQAVAANSQVQLGRLNLQEKQIAIAAARTDYFPKILGSAAYIHFNDDLGTVLATRERTLGGATIGPGGGIQLPSVTVPGRTVAANVLNQNTAFGTIMVAQPITKLIGVSVLVDLARADAQIAAAQLDKGTRDLLSGVTQAYYGLLAAKRIREALTLQAKALEPLVKVNPAVQLRLGLLEVRKGLAEADRNIAELTQLLNQLLGFPPCAVLNLVEPPLPPLMVTCVEEAGELAVANSPQIREAQQNIQKARAGLRAAKMDYLPDVNVVGGYVAQSAADYIQEDFTAVGVTASYTFWDWGKRGAVVRQRETQIALAGQNVRVTVEAVQLNARKAFLAFKQAEAELEIAKEVATTHEGAEKGITALPDLLTAKAATAKAQLDLMQAELTYRLAHVKLQAAVGQR